MKSANRPAASTFLMGNFLPWGQFSEPGDEIGYRVESANELFYLLAFSEDERFEELARQQGQG